MIPLHHYKTVSSTNDTAVSLLKERSVKAPFIVIADEQTQGRGRAGRSWQSIKGNLFTSIILSPNIPPVQWAQLAFLTGLTIVDVLKALGINQQQLQLKWPNDIYYHGQKCGGILIEAVDSQHVCIGIGLNLQDSPDDGSATDISVPPHQIAQQIGLSLLERLTFLQHQGFSAIRREWQQYALWLNQPISWRGHTGIFIGINEEGHAILKQDEGVQNIISGDIVSSSVDQ